MLRSKVRSLSPTRTRTRGEQDIHRTSYVKQMTHGVPQRSILGPLLFILYTNDFSRVSDLFFSIIFADDTSVIIEGTHLEQMIHNYYKRRTVKNRYLTQSK